VVAALAAAAPADAGKRSHKASGIAGTVVNTTCPGPCADPQPPAPAYTGPGLTVEVRRASDSGLVATRTPTDGRFRVRVKRGIYDVTATVSEPEPPPPSTIQPQETTALARCWQGDSEPIRVRRHRFTRVELKVQNICIV
jgi:hypothetical protein